jgi:excisionase family DNA binding protein
MPVETAPTESPALKLLLTPPEAAAVLSVSPRTLWGLTNCGKVRCVRLGRSVRYALPDLERYVDGLRAASQEAQP